MVACLDALEQAFRKTNDGKPTSRVITERPQSSAMSDKNWNFGIIGTEKHASDLRGSKVPILYAFSAFNFSKICERQNRPGSGRRRGCRFIYYKNLKIIGKLELWTYPCSEGVFSVPVLVQGSNFNQAKPTFFFGGPTSDHVFNGVKQDR